MTRAAFIRVVQMVSNSRMENGFARMTFLVKEMIATYAKSILDAPQILPTKMDNGLAMMVLNTIIAPSTRVVQTVPSTMTLDSGCVTMV